ncbi:MarR-like DNA-binding transcriptional regulator SgrR of sgrS sRNA [Paenibacillus rhizosphaerae]|uniref:MarR-like DNA-binding transcriptional regulator SgrR of sgrS sRNA n=1 Tax=Paenibacillus rhizosphaerae TaxID=297318 RepID=A0A839TPV4_9BACL|nr:MarR-like DNA-binding transcriptional regulator SgrR of sgrS sRNA [Paenibacillus rhizosphaerae]
MLLYECFGGNTELGLPVEVTLEELADAMYCTTRNAKLILRKLESDHLIEWLPGLGRGNHSRIVFKVDKEVYLNELLQNHLEQGDYKRAFDLIGGHGIGTLAKPKFLEWLDNHFGYKKGENGDLEDMLIFPVIKSPQTLDPAKLLNSFDSHLTRQIFDRLLHFDEQLGRIVPMIAHTWSPNSSATEWTFYLRKGVRFHNGQELTSKDVQFTLNRLQNGKSNSWLMSGVKSVDTIGPRALRVRLSRPNRIFDRFMSSTAASILPYGFAGMEEEAYWTHPIGTGPFRWVEKKAGRIKMAAYDTYFLGRPYLDGVDIVIMPEDCGPEMEGIAKVYHSLDTMRMDRDAPEDAWQHIEKLGQCNILLTWNVSREGPQRSEAFRRAVRMILHPGEMVAQLGGERGLPVLGFRSEASRTHMVESILPERVHRALEESGYKGEVLRFAFPEKYDEDGRWIVNRLASWGIQTEIMDYNQWKDSDFAVTCLILADDEVCEIEAYEHPDYIMQTYFDGERKAWITSQINAAVAAESTEQRRMFLKEIEEHIRDEATVIFLHHRKLSTFLHPTVRGVCLNPLGWVDFKEVWLEQA